MSTANPSPLLVLSLWEPWAILCVAPDPFKCGRAAPKEWETRGWQPCGPLPVRVAIHATKKMDPENRAVLAQWPFKQCLERCEFYAGDPRPFMRSGATPPAGRKLLPLGAIVGVATITRIERTENFTSFLGYGESDAEEFSLGNYAPRRFAWKLEETAMLTEPIPFSGRQSALYPISPSIEERIWAQLAPSGVSP